MSTPSRDISERVAALASQPRAPSGAWLERHAALFLMLMCACAFLPWIAAAPVASTSEADALVAAREVLTAGPSLTPTRNGVAELSAPPLGAWTLAAAGRLTGSVSPAVARSLSAAAVAALALILLAFARRHFATASALFCAGSAAAGAGLLGLANSSSFEALASVCTGAALLCGWSALRDTTTKRELAGAAFMLALAIFIRGGEPLVAWTIGAGASILGTNAHRPRRSLHAAVITALALAPTLLWIALLLARHATLPVALGDIASGLAGVGASSPGYNSDPPVGVGLEFLLGLAPLAPLLLLLWPVATPRAAAGADAERRSLWWFLVSSCLASALLYAATPGQAARLPIAALTSLALLLAWGFERASRATSARLPLSFLIVLVRALTWLAPFALLLIGWLAKWRPYTFVLGAAAVLLALRIAAAFGRRRAATPVLALALLLTVLTLRTGYGLVVVPKLARDFPAEGVSATIERLVPRDSRVLFVGAYSSPLHFAIDRPLELVRDEEELGRALAARPHSKLQPVFVFDAEDRVHEGPPLNLGVNGFWMRPAGPWRLLRAE